MVCHPSFQWHLRLYAWHRNQNGGSDIFQTLAQTSQSATLNSPRLDRKRFTMGSEDKVLIFLVLEKEVTTSFLLSFFFFFPKGVLVSDLLSLGTAIRPRSQTDATRTVALWLFEAKKRGQLLVIEKGRGAA